MPRLWHGSSYMDNKKLSGRKFFSRQFLFSLLTQGAAPGLPFHTASTGHLMMPWEGILLTQLFLQKLKASLDEIVQLLTFQHIV